MKTFIKRHKLIFSLLLFVQHLFYMIYFGFFMNLFRIVKIKKNKIVISNYFGKSYGDNAKYICDILLKKHKEKLDIVWLDKKRKSVLYPIMAWMHDAKKNRI